MAWISFDVTFFLEKKRICLYFECFVVHIKMSIAIKKRSIKVRVIANLCFPVLFGKKKKKNEAWNSVTELISDPSWQLKSLDILQYFLQFSVICLKPTSTYYSAHKVKPA